MPGKVAHTSPHGFWPLALRGNGMIHWHSLSPSLDAGEGTDLLGLGWSQQWGGQATSQMFHVTQTSPRNSSAGECSGTKTLLSSLHAFYSFDPKTLSNSSPFSRGCWGLEVGIRRAWVTLAETLEPQGFPTTMSYRGGIPGQLEQTSLRHQNLTSQRPSTKQGLFGAKHCGTLCNLVVPNLWTPIGTPRLETQPLILLHRGKHETQKYILCREHRIEQGKPGRVFSFTVQTNVCFIVAPTWLPSFCRLSCFKKTSHTQH